MRKTTKDYWEGMWARQGSIALLDPDSGAVVRQFDRRIHAFFTDVLTRWGERPKSIIEVGCGGSPYLPYFARFHGLSVAGLDYTESGCQTARTLLAGQGYEGEITQGDMFDPPDSLKRRFDIVFSMGLIEHFTDTASAIAAIAKLARPGGLIISGIPNMTGLPGFLQRNLDRALFDMHVPLDAAAFTEAHQRAGVTPLDSGYLMTANPYVLHYRNERSAAGKIFNLGRGALARLVWSVEKRLGREFPNRFTSPFVFCIGRCP